VEYGVLCQYIGRYGMCSSLHMPGLLSLHPRATILQSQAILPVPVPQTNPYQIRWAMIYASMPFLHFSSSNGRERGQCTGPTVRTVHDAQNFRNFNELH
jgi:hypothetical protein